MLSVNAATVRLFLHVLAATVWVGGQITLAGLVPGLRAAAPEAPRLAARRFNLLAWPAFAVLVATGVWNLAEVGKGRSTAFWVTLMVKLLVVAASGVTAFMHSVSRSKAGLAVFGALTGITAVLALFLGVLLHVGSGS